MDDGITFFFGILMGICVGFVVGIIVIFSDYEPDEAFIAACKIQGGEVFLIPENHHFTCFKDTVRIDIPKELYQ